MPDHEALIRELQETFQLEAQDHLDSLSTLLIALEREQGEAERQQLVESLFRRMHTLKGAAHAVNLSDVALTCQGLESLLSDLKRGDLTLELGFFDRLHREIDLLAVRILAASQGTRPSGTDTAAAAAAPAPATGRGETARPASAPPGSPPGSPAASSAVPAPADAPAAVPGEPRTAERREPAAAQETVRVPARLLESLLLQAEELVAAKLAAAALTDELGAWARELAGRAALRSRAQELAGGMLRNAAADPAAHRLAAVLQEGCEFERRGESQLRTLERMAERNQRALGGLIDPIMEELRQLQLLPFATLTDPFYKVVRDLARELGKEAQLTCLGGDLELDRRILAELKEPLLHLVRNMVDHGIEPAALRLERGKPARGAVVIELRLLNANQAQLTVRDDGRGIDAAQVKATALRLELLSPEAAGHLGEAELLQLVFESGFSTSPLITSVSGRGVGLAIVRESLERLGGHVVVATRPGLGTEFTMTLPLSFALIRGLRVEVAGRGCIIPAASVEVTARLPREEIRQVENRETVLMAGELCSLVSLAAVLELKQATPDPEDAFQQVVLVRAGERRFAFAVDQVLGVQEVLLKPLGGQLSRVRNVAGATVLGSGQVVPILNVNDLARSALLATGGTQASAPTPGRPRRLSVLVAEDSITSRTLLKNILEASGYRVATAIDGADALTQLKSEQFDVVVSDVEMPRMDGFQLTAAIRADTRLAELPLILVTGLESRADRERGIEVGANAYVVKSSFDQSNLVEVIERLT